ncbi:uracil-DNA glycosylase [Desulfurivibrio sp. D14AmB]|uniref:uracil-DNA glycosylase n=1 Tax=Desulfurivibrio sp. D14AmB TaxID=3374370 RepID=UPI00376F31FE
MTSLAKPDPAELRHLLTDLRGLILLHQSVGINSYPASPELARLLKPPPVGAAGTTSKPPTTGTGKPPAGGPASRAPAAPAKPGSQPVRGGDLTALQTRLGECRRCLLRGQTTRPVCGQGNLRARLLIIGAAPGPAEEAVGLPFQGEAGALLDRMLAAIKLKREEIYLTTLVKCAPPNSRPPTPEEVRECLPNLLAQIAALRPALICTLGQEPAQALLRSQLNLLQLRGRVHDLQGIPLIPTLAPEFLLLNPEMKKAAWEDLQLLQKRLARFL